MIFQDQRLCLNDFKCSKNTHTSATLPPIIMEVENDLTEEDLVLECLGEIFHDFST